MTDEIKEYAEGWVEEEIYPDEENAEVSVDDATKAASRKLDYTIESPEERTKYVQKIIDETPPEQLTNRYLEILANYIIFTNNKRRSTAPVLLHRITLFKLFLFLFLHRQFMDFLRCKGNLGNGIPLG